MLLLLYFCLLGRADVYVAPGSTPIEAVFRTSSLVCTCLVESVNDDASSGPLDVKGRSVTHHDVTAQVEVRDIFKSDESSIGKMAVRYAFDEQQKMRVAGSHLFLQRGQTVLLFLAQNAVGSYEFADPFVGATRFSSLPAHERGSGLEKLQQVMILVVKNSSGPDQLSALRVLLGFDHVTDETVLAVTPLTQSADADVALTAIAVQLRTKSLKSLERLQTYLEIYKSNAEPLALFVIGPELREISDPEALDVLESLSASRFRSIRSGAMDGVRKIRDPKSVSFLIGRLDDADSDIRYTALITLAETTGKSEGDFAPSMYLFEQKPQYYLGLWKRWWADEGRQLYPAPNHP
jgi:hypothetical protein